MADEKTPPNEEPSFKMSELTPEEMRARRLRTLAATSLANSPLAAGDQQKETNVPKSTTNLDLKIETTKDKIMDCDVEMKSCTNSPIKQSEPMDAQNNDAINLTSTTNKAKKRQESSAANETYNANTNERIEEKLSRILDATWNECGLNGSIICAEVATHIQEDDKLRFDFEYIVPEIIVECIFKFKTDSQNDNSETNTTTNNNNNCNNSTKNTSPTYSTPKKIKSDDNEVQEIFANALENNTTSNAADDVPSTSSAIDTDDSTRPSCALFNKSNVMTWQTQAFFHLEKCFQNCVETYETQHQNQRLGKQSDAQKFMDTLQLTKDCLIAHAVNILCDYYDTSNCNSDHSCLLDLFYKQRMTNQFLDCLVAEAYTRPQFKQIFERVLRGLLNAMQRNICTININTQQIEILSRLINVRVNNVRVLADLVAEQPNFMPPLCTTVPGREMVKCSFLGPFLSISLFAEENVKFADEVFKDKTSSLLEANMDRYRNVSKSEGEK